MSVRRQNLAGSTPAQRNQLRYGFNEIDGWAAFSMGEHRDVIRRRLKLMGTEVIRLFVFDKPVPDPFGQWRWFRAVVQAVLDAGAKPMITFAKFAPPFDRPANIARFVNRCTEVVWSCLEEWGGQEVKDWFWCVWNEPNNPPIGGGVKYAEYHVIYEAVADAVIPMLAPHLGGAKARIGGPSIDGTQQAFWMDWIAELVAEVDNRKIGFVNWHMYADWRPAASSASLGFDLNGCPDSPNGEVFQALAMAQTPQYEARARGVAQLVHGRDIMNVCGEINAVASHEHAHTLGLNQNAFGAAYYASGLIHLIRGGAELEMRWTATSKHWDGIDDTYGLMNIRGEPTPACLGKQLFAQHVRRGDWVAFPRPGSSPVGPPDPYIDAIVAWTDEGRRSGVLVNTGAAPRTVPVEDWGDGLAKDAHVLRLDSSTGGRVVQEPFSGTVTLNGHGIAVVSTQPCEVE
jgi:hypothetical protein